MINGGQVCMANLGKYRQTDRQIGEGCLDSSGLYVFREWGLMRDFDGRCRYLSPQAL